MAIDQHYNEVLDVMDHLFVYMFNGTIAVRPDLILLGTVLW